MASRSPVPKRLRLDPSASPSPSPGPEREHEGARKNKARGSPYEGEEDAGSGHEVVDENEEQDHCVICLHHIRDRTVLPCAHDRLCFECILVWTAQSRKCPLCNAPIGPFLIHNLRSKYDYSKYYLPPLRTSPPPNNSLLEHVSRPGSGFTSRARGRASDQQIHWGPRRRRASVSREREDELELAIERRRWVYRHGLYAKHVASNPYTRYRPAPTPAQISASPDLISRATIFVRRELRVWVNLDVEFLTTFILSLMKTLDLRSESAVKLLAEFLDMDTRYYVGDPEDPSKGRFTNAEHFSHELYSYLRSPFRDLVAYDSSVQYDTPSHVPPAPQPPSSRRRWDQHALTEAETSFHLPRRPSSPSPLSRSPRDAYSRSPSPTHTDSHDEYPRHRSPQVGGSHRAPMKDNSCNRASEPGNADTKDRGKAQARPRTDLERRHRHEDEHRRSRARGRSKEHLNPSGRLPAQSKSGDCSASIASQEVHHRSRPHRSPSNLSSSGQREHSHKSENRNSCPDSPQLAMVSDGTKHGKNAPGSITACGTRASQGGESFDKAVDHGPKTPSTSWGISIKGQAKYLEQNRAVKREESGFPRVTGCVETSPPNNIPKKRPYNVSSLDVLHAHLRHGSETRRGSTRTAAASAPVKDTPPVEPPVTVIAEETAIKQPSSESPHPQPIPTPHVSAREIMARTRAKLAKLRAESSQIPLADTASNIPTGLDLCEVTDGSASNVDARLRLLQRLEEEKRHATDEQRSLFQDRQSTRDKLNGKQQALPENECHKPLNEGRVGNDISCESHQAEIKLRAQTLLRVRLAAEKRKADILLEQESATSKEEALKARLLSRRI